jgi:pyridoxamine 5'-phosphate oxidase
MEQEIIEQIDALIRETKNIIVSSVDGNGYPNSKAMFKTEHEGWKTFLFSTNTSAMRTQQFLHNGKASIYFLGQSKMNGLMLVGSMEVCRDRASREKLWFDGCEQYYPLGIDDPDYSVLKFTAEKGNYYNSLHKYIFDV